MIRKSVLYYSYFQEKFVVCHDMEVFLILSFMARIER